MPDRLKSRIKTLREAEGLSQEQLAVALGTIQASVSLYERNRMYPEPEKMVTLCDVLHCTWGELYEVEPPAKNI